MERFIYQSGYIYKVITPAITRDTTVRVIHDPSHGPYSTRGRVKKVNIHGYAKGYETLEELMEVHFIDML